MNSRLFHLCLIQTWSEKDASGVGGQSLRISNPDTVCEFGDWFIFRYIAGAGLGCPTQSTQLMDCLFTYFKERLLEKLEAAPSRVEIKEYLTRRGEFKTVI